MTIKKSIHLACSLIALLLCAVACTNGDLVLSDTFAGSGSYATRTTDMNIELATFKMDSVQTSGQNIIWVGKANKPVLGDIWSESCFRVSEPLVNGVKAYSWTQDGKEVYDSVCIVLIHTGDYQGDTTKTLDIDVSILRKRLEFEQKESETVTETAFYDGRVFEDSVSIGTFSFVPKPHIRPKIRYRLPDQWGKEFVEFIKSASKYDNDAQTQRFNKYIPGIKLKVKEGTDPGALVAFRADSARIVIHSHLKGMREVKVERCLQMTDANLQYNHVWTQNIEKPFDTLKNRVWSVSENDAGGHSVLYEGLGYYTRINFPISELQQLSGYYGHIVKAILKLHPERGSYDRLQISNFRTLYLYEINENNVLGNALYTYTGSQANAVLYFNSFDVDESYYAIDVTYYLNTILNAETIQEDQGIALMWQAGMLPTNYNFMLFSGHGKELNKSELEIYYYDYDRIDK